MGLLIARYGDIRHCPCLNLVIAMVLLLGGSSSSTAQVVFNPDTVKPGRFDNGKMWTFEEPPTAYFQEAYGFTPTAEWLARARKASLRFTEVGGTGSFVSPNGLIMTNHHVAREVAMKVARGKEDFNADGFYARSLKEERNVPGLFVDQLERIEDITRQVESAMATAKSESEKIRLRDSALAVIRLSYGEKDGWNALELQTVILYSGGRYSLYGFRRYTDIRLVFIPELQLGYFGGDPDNFTFPRYALDVAFFRAYDTSGKPVSTPDFYRFNPRGVKEGEPVFVVGNPGRTERLSTVAELQYSRDAVLPIQLRVLRTRSELLKRYNETAKSDSILNLIFEFENSIKAYSGRLAGLQNSYLFQRKVAFEQDFKQKASRSPAAVSDSGLWREIDALIQENNAQLNLRVVLNSQDVGLQRGYALAAAIEAKESGDAQRFDMIRAQVLEEMISSPAPDLPLEEAFWSAHLQLALDLLGANDPYVMDALQGESPSKAAKRFISKTGVYDLSRIESAFDLSLADLKSSSDPFLKLGASALSRLRAATKKQRETNSKIAILRSRLAKLFFDLYGSSTPPDATFSLRINDGVVAGYEYNGTTAPYQTTYYGLYDRFYSHEEKYPWSLPKRWQNPPTALLRAPMNFVSTNDIIGGNSGSATINQRLEAVGLIFDGNIESLPGSFIYDPTFNRAVSVHVGGIVAALQHIYKAERLLKEVLQPSSAAPGNPPAKVPAKGNRRS